MKKTLPSFALKLHAHGLSLLHNPNWTGCELYDRLKQHVRGREAPVEMLYKTLKEGLLFHLGLWIQEDYLNEDYIVELDDEYKVWYLADILQAAKEFDPTYANSSSFKKTKKLLKKIDKLCDASNDSPYYDFLESEYGHNKIYDAHLAVCNDSSIMTPEFRREYARDYAERVFHDRQLCGFISQLLVAIGFDGTELPHETKPKKWIPRASWPRWAIKSVCARDRGHCAICGANLILELENEENIDHIVPLSKGGTNDLVNLQLLCKDCNARKLNRLEIVRSSVPPYLKKHRQDRS